MLLDKIELHANYAAGVSTNGPYRGMFSIVRM